MFSRISKQALSGMRRFSNEAETQLETWIKINDRMHIEAASKAEGAVSGVKSEIAIVKADVSSLKFEVSALKAEIKEVRADVSKLASGQIEIHKQISNSTRSILAGIGVAIGMVGTFFAANRYLDDQKWEAPKIK